MTDDTPTVSATVSGGAIVTIKWACPECDAPVTLAGATLAVENPYVCARCGLEYTVQTEGARG